MDVIIFKRHCHYALIALVLINCVNLSAQEECLQTTSCSCETGTEILDLQPLSSGANPRFTVTGNYVYTYEPCVGITGGCGDEVTDVAVCQKSKQVPPAPPFVVGFQSKAKFIIDTEKNQWNLTYKNNKLTPVRTTRVMLTCVDSIEGELRIISEDKPEGEYMFELRSKYACRILITLSEGVSTGTILLIIFFVLVFCYLVGGMLFLRFVKGARGMEMMPNSEFWTDLPAAVRDGTVFVFKGFKADNTYEKI
ncbi:hypothetical protein ScPMuIL_016225 [Solemya velum]